MTVPGIRGSCITGSFCASVLIPKFLLHSTSVSLKVKSALGMAGDDGN